MQLKIIKITCNGHVMRKICWVPRNAAGLAHRISLSPGYNSYRRFYKKNSSENGDIGIYLIPVGSSILIR